MDFNFVESETQEEDEEEFLDLSDLYEDEDEKLQVAGLDVAFESEVPEAMSITDPEVRRRARKGRKKRSSKSYDKRVGFKRPYIHGLCKQGMAQDAVTKLPAHHSVCQMYEEWNVRAGIPCACPECNHPQTLEELTHGKDPGKNTTKSRRKRIRSEPKSLSGSSDGEFVLVID